MRSTAKGPAKIGSLQRDLLIREARWPRRYGKKLGWWFCVAFMVGLGPLHGDDLGPKPGPFRLPNPQKIPLNGPVHFQARNIIFHVMDDVHLDVKSVDALLLPSSLSEPVTLDDPNSMKVRMQSGDTSISAEDMSTLLNKYALPRSNLPLRDVKVTFEDGEAHFTGKVHKLIDLPFSASATVGVTAKGNFHLHFNNITAAGILHKKLLDFFGLSIADLAKRDQAHSFHIHGDDVDFPIHILFPAPYFTGYMSSATIVGDRMVQVFGVIKPFTPAPVPAEHYIYFRGGVMAFGRLSMQGVDLEMLNKDGDNEFEFSIQNIFRQVLAGYLKNLPDHGLVGYIASYRDPDTADPTTHASVKTAENR